MVLGDDASAQWVGGIEELRKEVEDAAKAATARFEKLARSAGLSAESRWLPTTFLNTRDEFGRMARRFDISIVRQAEPKTGRSDDLIIHVALARQVPSGQLPISTGAKHRAAEVRSPV